MMKVTPFWALIALSSAPAVLAQTTTTTAAAPSCTASQIAKLCSYKEPGVDFAIASDSRAFCWEYCNEHTPCDFVIFVEGNPFTGTGTCWVYPGESYDASLGSSDCGNPYLDVYSKPECVGGSPTTSAGACPATASPSAVAEVCGYPTPPNNCFDSCTASSGASDCLSQCVNADSCTFAVFNPHNPDNSPFASGTCWMYPSGMYDASLATTCSGAPEQYVYNNPCPKPSHPTSTSSSSSSASSTSLSSLSSTTSPSSYVTSTHGSSPYSPTTLSSTTSCSTSSLATSYHSASSHPLSSSSSHSPSASAAVSGSGSGSGSASASTHYTGSGEKMMPTSFLLSNILAVGMVVLAWCGL